MKKTDCSAIMKNLSKFVMNHKIETAIVLLTVAVFGISLLEFPFQGEIYYAYIAQEILRGYPVFSTTTGVKPPMIYFLDAALMGSLSFIPNYLAIRIGMMGLGIATMILFYKVLQEVTKDNTLSLISVLLCLSFTYFIQDFLNSGLKPFILAMTFIQLLLLFRKKYFLSSIFAGISFMTWQPSGVMIFAPLVYAFLKKEKFVEYLKIIAGFSIPVILVLIYFAANGLLDRFIYYTIELPMSFNAERFELFNWLKFYGIVGYYNTELLFLAASFVGAVTYAIDFVRRMDRKDIMGYLEKHAKLLAYLAPFVLMLMYSVFDFQGSDDVIILLPAIVLFAGYSIKKLSSKIPMIIVMALVLAYGFLPYLQPVYPENQLMTDAKDAKGFGELLNLTSEYSIPDLVYYSMFHRKGEEMTLGQQLEMANYIRTNTEYDEKIFSMGAPELLFLSGKENINEYFYLTTRIYTEDATRKGIIEDMRNEIIESDPKYIVSRNVWMVDRVIGLLSIEDYLEDNYEQISMHPEYLIWERLK